MKRVLLIGVLVFLPQVALAGSQTFTSSGTFIVPAYGTLTVEVWGGGASGGGSNGYVTSIAGNSGTQSSFFGVVAGGGIGPAAGTGSGGLTGGVGGIASGGDTNTSGGAGSNGRADFCPYAPSGAGGASPNGGAGGAGISAAVPSNPGSAPGGGGGGGLGAQYQPGQGLWYCRGAAGGGAGAYSKKTYAAGALTPGSSVTVTVGSGGAAPSAAGPGGAGAAGRVTLTWADAASCTFNGSTVAHGASVTAYQTSSVPYGSSCVSENRTCNSGTLSGSYIYGSCSVAAQLPPAAPTITGPTSGITKTSYTYTFRSTDPDSDTLRYAIDWDNNGSIDEYVPALGYVPSGTTSSTSHSWNSSNTQTFKALAQDSNEATSGWASYTVNMSPNAPTVLFTTSSYSYTQGNSPITLTWSSSNASSCTASASPSASDWNGAKAVGNPAAVTAQVTPIRATTYTITCSGTTAPAATASIPVTYSCPASIVYSCTGAGNATIRKTEVSSACATTITDFTPACLSPRYCQAGNPQCIDPTPIFNPVGSFSGHLQAAPSLIRKNNPTTLHWNVSNVTSCTVKGDVVDTTGWSGKSGTQATSNILSRTTYTLDCLKTDNTHLRESTVVNIVPVFEEK
ncbi:hypothetical protein A3D71_03455 [Candidatus Kaiserbacteria bacterium RIFCSPHIGHO2_02_FULL_55_20]|uniref:Ig-like domain-containing protein n=1 Tax=Candidatus Kaiserbacteria bacterium RIFCSPHIGHO2_02_FULL_55_20 TaxID=1798497 RepID=A0A1F6DV27_9BACT|nr:MAG: hypothetical protein A2680_04270 [Candidatus Kaiserbacteria bacterium RIFCSPHIGHO2_01_FULL_55_37]OGG65271.1 MAG: hypothetical protein A3D71_03455 [Candidatus Kaiserbacteria bacterium RIFCSPHIGHO2_02_FULL_55_20]